MPLPDYAGQRIVALARTLSPAARSAFERDASVAVSQLPVKGEGIVHRVVTAIWLRHFEPPSAGEARSTRSRGEGHG
jgi:hypothetical protein